MPGHPGGKCFNFSISEHSNEMKIEFEKLHHVQLCVPFGVVDRARAFYCDILGLKEIPKPAPSVGKGGFWVQIADVELHIGVENVPGVSKRHPAFIVKDLEAARAYLVGIGLRIQEDSAIPGRKRFSFFDPWNNRIELMQFD
jgi:catechol 2,3-dioxygenase-like lactoylglutathione lyase family enzyme